ncbi:hypothetical protein ENUP19_0048G0017 [Entamoeba nuttalli]|uniref:Uncharacterized protein n=1 Tax=Entamoeba nuttalli TaxID=412467 RepID=A0ABQ0DBG5_9EUKA
MEEDNNQYNQMRLKTIEYTITIEDKDDKEFNKEENMIDEEEEEKNKRNRGKSGGGYERERRNEKGNPNKRPNH